MKKGFTLIELLAVIVILAIIALIATPIILGTINDSKERATELSVKNYIRAVELAVSNKYVKDPTINLDGQCEIVKETNGKKIKCGTNDPIPVEYSGEGLTEGTITLKKGEVTRLNKGKIDEKYVMYNNGKITLFDGISTLVSGEDFNKAIKTLATGTPTGYSAVDTTVTSIEFYSNSKAPKEIKSKLGNLNKVDVSSGGKGSIMAYFDNGKVYVISDNLISFNENSSSMFYNCQSVENINFSDIDTSDVTNMSYMFYGCKGLTELDVSNFETKGVTTMEAMFSGCGALTSLDVSGFDTSDVTSMYAMFGGCKGLTELDVSNFETKGVKRMDSMFNGCGALTKLDVSDFDTSDVTHMDNMFAYCSSLTNIDVSRFDTSNVIRIYSMFASCSSLTSIDISHFNLSGVTSLNNMFASCSNLKELKFKDTFDTSNIQTMYGMFNGCSGLTTLDISHFNTSNVTDMAMMFFNCSSLTSLDISNFDTSKVTTMHAMFEGTTKLKPIYIGEKWTIGESTIVTRMFGGATENVEQLCEPNSTEEWCVVTQTSQ